MGKTKIVVTKVMSTFYADLQKKCLLNLSNGDVVWLRCLSQEEYAEIAMSFKPNKSYSVAYSTITYRLISWGRGTMGPDGCSIS
jgi:hypothetical protein